jgi:hypothetical protein
MLVIILKTWINLYTKKKRWNWEKIPNEVEAMKPFSQIAYTMMLWPT